MGRLRNLSQSLKAAALPIVSSGSSPVSANQSDMPHGSPTMTNKQAPVATREASSSSALTTQASSTTRARSDSRPISQFYDPPTMGSGREDQIEELRPVFSFLSSHQNKLYQEGYFLKLNDLDTHGKPNSDRNWTECFAQLVGTVLSLWDATALDAAGQDGEVAPTFINLADASIKMIETLPTRNKDVEPLQNVLSISTAGKNRYLLHFNSLHSLTQWTAGIRLSMFEHSSLQELYTGSLIAGKGKTLNNIRSIMEKLRYREEDWCRVRFGAGTPWRRCWYVIDPPDEKEWQKANKNMKKKGLYERVSYPKGDLKFYDSKKTKKTTPVATITDVYSAYAVYPQSKPLIEQSTLTKIEGKITIHSNPESTTEGFVFVMPEVHPAVSGFEILLRFLFPVYDTFGLYGRPNRLVADKLDSRGLMFAMPQDRRYGYLDILDVASLIHTDGSDKWSEREWRKQTKDQVSRRISGTAPSRRSESDNPRRSLGSRPAVRFGDSSPVEPDQPSQSTDAVFQVPKKTYTAPPAAQSTPSFKSHVRSVSETLASMSPNKRRQPREPSKLAYSRQDDERHVDISPPAPPAHGLSRLNNNEATGNKVMQSNNSSDSDVRERLLDPEDVSQDLPVTTPPIPVAQPTFNHQANDQPTRRPRDRPDLRREKSRMSSATLSQMVDANRSAANNGEAGAAAAAAWNYNGRQVENARGVNTITYPEDIRMQANHAYEAINTGRAPVSEDTGVFHWRPTPRPSSQHSVTRKPVSSSSRPTTPNRSKPIDDPFASMEDLQHSVPVHSSLHQTSDSPDGRIRKLGGIRKTIGDPTYDPENRKSDIPDIDFGVTRSLDPGSNRSSIAGRASPLQQSQHTPPGPRTPQEERRSPFGRVSPLSDRSRPVSQVWQPGSQPAAKQSPQALTPEEFVQQRAVAAARVPQGYAPRRNQSPAQYDERPSSPATSPAPRRLQKKNSSRPSSSASHDFGGNLPVREGGKSPGANSVPYLNVPKRTPISGSLVGHVGSVRRDDAPTHVAPAEMSQRQPAQVQHMPQMQSQMLNQQYYAEQTAHQQNQVFPLPQQFPGQQPINRTRPNYGDSGSNVRSYGYHYQQ